MMWPDAFDRVIGHEGGYVNNPKDPGGETNFGISKRSYPNEDIAGMTLKRAREIYKRDYWDKCGCPMLPNPLDFQVFDAAVNSGCSRAAKWLQAALGVKQDGKVGRVTIRAAWEEKNVYRVSAAFLGERLRFMASLSTWDAFGRGWARRIASDLKV